MKTAKDLYYTLAPSPIGELTVIASDTSIYAVLFSYDKKIGQRNDDHPLLKRAKQQLKEYFDGERKDFDLPLSPEGTAFQKLAWGALLRIPFGKTISYQEQAIKLGDIKKARAVGTANSQNPIAIIVPCHRVVAKSGKLSGYAGGIHVKSFLLEHERKFLK
jgi:methylated-DNA-[protein]-cysteine S-methyltransferase